MPIAGIDLTEILELYDQNRYLDAYGRTEALWGQPELVHSLSPPELIHAGRLANRLGNDKVRRWLFRVALERAPADPVVRYFTAGNARPRWHILEHLRNFEAPPDFAGVEPWVEASWYASHAHLLATVRDFKRAHQKLERARAVGVDRAWVSYCEAEVLLFEDRWDESVATAEEGWKSSPGMPALASVFGRALVKLGRLEEASDRLTEVAQAGQSFPTLSLALWYLCARAERSGADERERLARRALALSERLEALAPLADRDTRSQIAFSRVDAAMLLGDRELLRAHCAQVNSPFFHHVIENLERSRNGGQRLLEYRRVYQKHLTCLPASVAAVGSAFGEEVDEDALTEALTYGGTALWRVTQWLEARGFAARPFVVTPELARALLEADLPFIYITNQVSYSHATAAVGIDEATGTLIIHDPGQVRWDRVLLDRLHEDEAPLGPEGLVVVRDASDPRLDLIPPRASEPYTAYVEYRRLQETQGPRAGAEIVERLTRDWPDDPYTRRLTAIHRHLRGEPVEAIAIQRALLEEHPDCVLAQRDLIGSLHATRDSAQIRATLEQIIERSFIPGRKSSQQWQYVPATYLAQLADYIGVTADHYARSERLLDKAITYEPFLAESHHVLGDVLYRQDRLEDAVLPYKVAASLEAENDHYARALCDVLRFTKREEEGLAVLRQRVEALGDRVQGYQAWSAWIEALEDFGRPDEAMAAMRSALASRPDDAPLWAYASRFWVRMGRWEQARECLARVEASENRGQYLGAAVHLHQTAGEWREALELGYEWVEEQPQNTWARRALLDLVARARGRKAAVKQAREWAEEHAGDDELEGIYYEELRRVFDDDGAEALLQRRVERNPHDGWAWRERAHRAIDEAELKRGDARSLALDEAGRVVARCSALAPEDPSTFVIRARLYHAREQDGKAVQILLEALERESNVGWVYQTAWDWAESLEESVQRDLSRQLERALLKSVGFLHNARPLAMSIARRFGVADAEAAVDRWLSARPNDPEVLEAQADLLLECGQGTSDAERAVVILEDALERFPNHFDMRFSLANAYGVLLQEEKEIEAFEEILRRQPLNTPARRHLSRVLARRGETSRAVEMLRQGTEYNPDDADAWGVLGELHWEMGELSRAVGALQEATERLPEALGLRERLIEMLHDLGDHGSAVAVARGGLDVFPDGAYCWFLLAEALYRSDEHTDVVEVEGAYRKALSLNSELHRAGDGLAVLLAGQRRFDEARKVLEEQRHVDPAAVDARLAWVTREAGGKAEARQQMAGVLERWPLLRWAWWAWMEWAEEDESHSEIRALLDDVHAALLDDPQFCARRLALLEVAGVPTAELDPQWEKLLGDYPQEAALHLRRFDVLRDADQWERAGRVLDAFERFLPYSPFVQARRVQLLMHRGAVDEAVEAAVGVWTAPGDDDQWPEKTAWEALVQGGAGDRAAVAVSRCILAGERVRPEALNQWLANETAAENLEAVLDALEAVEWDAGPHIAAALEALERQSEARVVRRWQRNRDRYRAMTPVWQAVGNLAPTNGRHNRLALREWLRGWREQAGVQMWAVANYTLTLRRGSLFGPAEDLQELHRSSRDALERLPVDHTARYLICVLCEATLRLGKIDELRNQLVGFRRILSDQDSGYWLPDDYQWAPGSILALGELMGARESAEALEASSRLRSVSSPAAAWVGQALSGFLTGKVSIVRRLWERFLWWATRRR